jgi:NADPH:quinone reductase-like Zn-dependent oxidoreductase
MKPYLGDGGLGEHVAAPAAFVAKVPAAVELATAGALGLAGTAAIDAVDAIAPNRAEVVLVAGATGGVGAIAVQLLKAKGVRVIATAATSQERAFVTELGADNAVDYRGDLAAGVKALQPGGVDAALHFAGDGPSQIPQSHDARLPTSDRRSNWRQYARVSGSSYRSTGTR